MKIKPVIAFAAVVLVALLLQWVSGVPFERNPDEAWMCLFTLILAGYAAVAAWMFE